MKEKPTECYRCGNEAELFKCKYCNKYFCEEHSEPSEPEIRKRKDIELYGNYNKRGHRCLNFDEYKHRKEEKINRNWKEAIADWTRTSAKKIERSDRNNEKSGTNVFSRIPKSLFSKSESRTKNITDEDKEHKEYFSKKTEQPISTERSEPPEESKAEPRFRIPTKAIVVIILLIAIGYIIFTYNKEIMKFLPIYQNVSKECTSNLTKVYESGASFGREPFTYCKDTCIEKYNSTIYKVIEPNVTYKLTACYCNVSSCKT